MLKTPVGFFVFTRFLVREKERKGTVMRLHISGATAHVRGRIMKQLFCAICAWVYDPESGDPENGVKPGTPWEKVPATWVCPLCGGGKDDFFTVK
jgi:rubredoxin